MSDARALRRASGTAGLYAMFGCLGYLLTGLGAILPELREERGLPRGEVALYPSAFALGLVIVGIAGHWAAARLGRLGSPAALAALVAGAGVMAAGGGRLGAGLGALVLGLGGAGLVQLVPAALRAAHPDGGTVQIGVANAVSSAASVLSPILIGASLAHGLGWRAAFAIPPLAVAAVLIAVGRPAAAGTPEAGPAGAGPRRTAPPAFRRRWLDLVLAVGVEFCMVFWAADFLGDVKGLGSGAAATLSAAFVLGMAVGRAAAGPAVRRGGRLDRLLAMAALLGLAGFAVLWTSPAPLAVAGLLVAGLGVALLYPVILGQALGAWPEQPVRAAARCALASGVAIGVAPLVLGTLADLTTLRAAVFVAPALLLVLLARCVRRLSPARSR
ncbi:MFS transporter [Actinomadura bangladeshensis]|uniref:MFS transporter n=1 Tax=Actinomadura bangladeshensis TaxID=453573 RepID=A0A4R4NFD2_9ACTN|nr:MFS transporter [Actinomadura bangladeshensis]TDC07891.1 MFS transporter [Actinomadura bangladeshensis]